MICLLVYIYILTERDALVPDPRLRNVDLNPKGYRIARDFTQHIK